MLDCEQIINKIFRQNEDHCMARYIERANTYEELPDFEHGCRVCDKAYSP